MANSQGQVTWSMMKAEASRPRIPPAPVTPAHSPTALPRASSGNEAVITDKVTGITIAAPAPATIRPTMSSSGVPARAAARLPAANTARPASSTGLRPQRSPTAPADINSAARAIV